VVKKFLGHTTPSARANVASRLSLDRASTPPPAEEGSRFSSEFTEDSSALVETHVDVADYLVIFMTVILDAPET
jgi:hypothetical protein